MSRRVGRKLGTPGLVALVALALGFGQSLALLKFFGRDDAPLSAANQKVRAPVAHPANGNAAPPHAEPASHADERTAEPHAESTEEGAEPAPARPLDVLDTARDMLDRGDIAGARRIATAYLLRIDGMSQGERGRASAAYAVLGDAMRAEYTFAVETHGGDR